MALEEAFSLSESGEEERHLRLLELERERVHAAALNALFGGGACVRLGRFELERRLGAGATGVVYRARDTELDRSVALKVLDAGPDTLAARQRLSAEARALAKLSHPNVVTIHDIGEARGLVFIAMELVDGHRLDAWIARSAPSWREILSVLLQAGSGIQAAHARGLVHRDIKPSNIVVDGHGQARVVDFGLARADVPTAAQISSLPLGQRHSRGTGFAGTPSYAAPEQLEGRSADARSDQFAFAATVWELLQGTPPFGGETVAERLRAIRRARFEPPRRRVPRRLLAPLRKALEYDPARRFDSLEALLVALARADAQGRRRLWSGVAAVAVVLMSGLVWRTSSSRAHQGNRVVAAFPDGSRDGVLLACPPLEVEGDAAITGWLGGAAANLACRRAVWMLGGRQERVLYPAALIGLESESAEATASDPWARDDVRASALGLARRRTSQRLVGRVVQRNDHYEVTLAIERATGEVSSETHGESPQLHLAVRAAMEGLEAGRVYPVAGSVDPEVSRWTGIRSPLAGALRAELDSALYTTPEVGAACSELRPLADDLGYSMATAESACDIDSDAVHAQVPIDESALPALALTAPLYLNHPARASERKGDVVAKANEIASRLARAREAEASLIGRNALAWSEAQLLHRAGDSDGAARLLLPVIDAAPTDWAVRLFAGMVSANRAAPRPSTFSQLAWNPDVPEAWASAARAMPIGCDPTASECSPPPQRLNFQRHAWDLGKHPGLAIGLALRLLERGATREARTLGVSLATRSETYESASALALGLADAKEGWLGRGLQTLQKELGSLERLRMSRGDLSLLLQTARLGEVVGARAAVGELVARHFVLAEPHRMPLRAFADLQIAAVCMHAPRAVALKCLSRLGEIRAKDGQWVTDMEGAQAFMAGAVRFAEGDLRGAAKQWRPYAATEIYSALLPAEVFDAAGEPEIAEAIDGPHLAGSRQHAGIHMAFARAAKRALAKGDRATARRLAQRVISAWGSADVVVPAVAEMRTVIRKAAD
ncbi:MAG: serine/threonine-protein kinase [Polyangiaceae bacterium]